MKKALSLLLLLPACGLLNAAEFKTNQAASVVLGQAAFTTDATGATATGMDTPRGVAVDPTTGKVFVADRNNHRVLRFASIAALTSGAAAERVLGQPDLTTTINHTVSQTSMLNPLGLAFDAAGRLYVADTGFNRVLRFNAPSAALTDGIEADGVLGQPDFTTTTATITQAGMNGPSAVTVEPVGSTGFLWVADSSNNRVLGFSAAEGLANGANASKVLGQGNSFVANAAADPPTDKSLKAPEGIVVSSDGFLWVADSGNNRVLAYNNPRGQANGLAAFNVFGQATFTANAAPVTTSASNLFSPEGLALDESGATYSLWVVDRVQNRVLRFDDVNTVIPNGSSAAIVLGQPSFTASGSNTTQTGFEFPFAVAVDSFNVADAPRSILVADANNHRVLRFDPQLPAPPTLSLSGVPKKTKSKSLKIAGTVFAEAGVGQVLYKGKKGGFKTAKGGGNLWFFTAKLKVGKNKFTIQAIDALGQASTPKKVVVKREEK
jgi:DNA-binding beta-propeller fold protein YncE